MIKKILALIITLLLLSSMTLSAFASGGYSGDGEFDLGQMIIVSLVIGIVVGLIVAFSLKAQLKSVRKRYTAHEYIREGSVRIKRVGDFYLYRNVVRTRRQQNNK